MTLSLTVQLDPVTTRATLPEVSVAARAIPQTPGAVANVRLGELSTTAQLPGLSTTVSVAAGGTVLQNIPFSADRDTNLEFSGQINFSIDNPDPGLVYYWELQNAGGYREARGGVVSETYSREGQFSVNVFATDRERIVGANFKKNLVSLNFAYPKQLLDKIEGDPPEAAFSLRLLSAGFTGPLLRLRAKRNGETKGKADVLVDDKALPDGSVTISTDSQIKNFTRYDTQEWDGTPTTLGEFVNPRQTTCDGFVEDLYDQTPNGRDFYSNNYAQPKLVQNGQLITINGRPAMQFDGASQRYNQSEIFDISDATLSVVYKPDEIGGGERPFGLSDADRFGGERDTFTMGSDNTLRFDGGMKSGTITPEKKQIIRIARRGQGYLEDYINGVTNINSYASLPRMNAVLSMAQVQAANRRFFEGYVQEAIYWDNYVSSSDGDLIENNQNSFFGAF